MKKTISVMTATVVFVLGGVVAAVMSPLLPATPAAAQAGAGGPGPRPSDLLTVGASDAGLSCPGGFQGAREVSKVLQRDGTAADGTYAVPPGKVFVITDVIFQLNGNNADTDVLVRLGVPEGPGKMWPLVDTIVSTGAFGDGGTQVSLQHGIVVEPGVTLCVADVNHSSPNTFASVSGYLAVDK